MNKPPREASAKITATLEFSNSGRLKSILLNAKSDVDTDVLERALNRIMKPRHVYDRLFEKDPLGINPILLMAALIEEREP